MRDFYGDAQHGDRSGQDLGSVIDRVRRIRGVTYEWIPGARESARHPSRGGRELGVIAQEVEAVFPEAVAEDAEGYKVVDYAALVAVLIEAVKELADQVDAQRRAT